MNLTFKTGEMSAKFNTQEPQKLKNIGKNTEGTYKTSCIGNKPIRQAPKQTTS
jgi:hypothetical protein